MTLPAASHADIPARVRYQLDPEPADRAAFVSSENAARPVYARVARDNARSVRVLEKCGFVMVDTAVAYAAARDAEIEELVFQLPQHIGLTPERSD